jgi:hypothetical protein
LLSLITKAEGAGIFQSIPCLYSIDSDENSGYILEKIILFAQVITGVGMLVSSVCVSTS